MIFHIQLLEPTDDDLEVCLCTDEDVTNEDIYLESMNSISALMNYYYQVMSHSLHRIFLLRSLIIS